MAKAKKAISVIRKDLAAYKNERDRGFHHYSSNWSQGGPLIDLEDIELQRLADAVAVELHPTFSPGDRWEANIWLADQDPIYYCGPTPLIAAMRCFVASRLGDEVEIPEGLK